MDDPPDAAERVGHDLAQLRHLGIAPNERARVRLDLLVAASQHAECGDRERLALQRDRRQALELEGVRGEPAR